MRHVLLTKALAARVFSPYPVFSLVLFFTVFALVLVWVFRPNAKKKYQEISDSILND